MSKREDRLLLVFLLLCISMAPAQPIRVQPDTTDSLWHTPVADAPFGMTVSPLGHVAACNGVRTKVGTLTAWHPFRHGDKSCWPSPSSPYGRNPYGIPRALALGDGCVVAHRLGDLDAAIIREWRGEVEMSPERPLVGARLNIILARCYDRVDRFIVTVSSVGQTELRYRPVCTVGGDSGAGLYDDAGRLVAIHRGRTREEGCAVLIKGVLVAEEGP